MIDQTGANVPLAPGMDVHDANGDNVGKITEVNEDEFVVEKGFFFPKDYVVSLTMVEHVDGDGHVVLNVPKESLLEDVTGESSAADLELAGSTSFDPTIAASAGIFPQGAGIDADVVDPHRDDR